MCITIIAYIMDGIPTDGTVKTFYLDSEVDLNLLVFQISLHPDSRSKTST